MEESRLNMYEVKLLEELLEELLALTEQFKPQMNPQIEKNIFPRELEKREDWPWGPEFR